MKVLIPCFDLFLICAHLRSPPGMMRPPPGTFIIPPLSHCFIRWALASVAGRTLMRGFVAHDPPLPPPLFRWMTSAAGSTLMPAGYIEAAPYVHLTPLCSGG